jgi:hypothetical protein
MVRIRAAGRFDIAAIVAYPPPGNDVASRRDYSNLMLWVTSTIAGLGKRCTPVVMIDANAKTGETELRDERDQILIGMWGAEKENRHSGQFRALVASVGLRVVNTMSQHGSGATFRGCTGHSSRIDFVLLPPSTTVTHVSVCYKAGLRLQLARTLGWMDHAPVQCRFLHQSWFDGDADNAHLCWRRKGRCIRGWKGRRIRGLQAYDSRRCD